MNTTCTNGIGTARAYIERGWSPVPIPPREKAPTIKNWQNLRLTTSQVSLFAGDRNIGVLLGAPSGLLVDVDLDHPLAVELADRYLPTTGAEFGRASKQRSHRLYRLTAPADTQKWQTSDRKMIVELRGTGCQTVFPHSTHPSGERIDWSIDGEPAQVDPDTLRQACAALAAEVLHQLGETSEHKRNESPRRNGSVGHGSRAKIVDRARKYIGKMPPGISGQGGHDATLAAACELFRFGLTDSEAAAVLDEFNQRCEPQWSDKELAHKLDDAREKVTAAGEFGSRLGGTKRTPKRSRNEPGSSCKRDDIDVSRLNFPEVPLPSSETTIRESAEALAKLLAETGRFFTRGSVPMRMTKDDDGQPILEPIRPAALCSDLESVARLVKAVKSDDGFELVPANCSESNARLILGADVFRAALPPINIVSRCPVLLQRGDQLVAVVGYDRESGVFASGSVDQDISFDLARQMFCDLFLDSSFTTPGDRARALAAVITPAMVAGNLLRGRAPIDLGEADQSQAGKGFRNKLTAAIYGCTPRMITQRSGGVGSLNETFDKALIGGAFIIAFDNLRGRLDLPSLESFLTEDTYFARVPYGAPMLIDPRRFVIMMTTNRAETTPDLANRSSCVRILKRPDDYQFRKFPEGDLLDHVVANQARYLGAVFSIVREWHRRGQPELPTAKHDFRRWARVLGYIVEKILDAGELLAGHRDAQERIASPGLNWLRDVAMAVQAAQQAEFWLRPHNLLTIIAEAGIEIPGVDAESLENDNGQWLRATQSIGRKMSKLFKKEKLLVIDNFKVARQEAYDEHYRPRTEFAFFPQTPKCPE